MLMKIPTFRRTPPLAASAVLGLSLLVSACGGLAGGATSVDELADLASAHDAVCPDDESIRAQLFVDLSNSVVEQTIREKWLPAVRAELRVAAACGDSDNPSKVTVVAFAGNAAGTVLFDDDVTPTGATVNARHRRVDEEITSALEDIEAEIDSLLTSTDRRGTNIAAQLSQAAATFSSEPADEVSRRMVILTDGRATGSTTSSIDLPDDFTVVIAGIGTTGEDQKPIPQDVIDDSIAALTALCESTGATCQTPTTNYAGPTRS